jgi:hypothetical protein
MLGVTSAVRLTAATTGFALGLARGVAEEVGQLAQFTLGSGRRIWTGAGRTHMEYQSVEPTVHDDFLRELEETFRGHPDVTDVTFIPETGRVVVHHEKAVAGAELADLLTQVEEQFDAATRHDRAAHPSEVDPIVLGLIELGADIVGIGLARCRTSAASHAAAAGGRSRLDRHASSTMSRSFTTSSSGMSAAAGPICCSA